MKNNTFIRFLEAYVPVYDAFRMPNQTECQAPINNTKTICQTKLLKSVNIMRYTIFRKHSNNAFTGKSVWFALLILKRVQHDTQDV